MGLCQELPQPLTHRLTPLVFYDPQLLLYFSELLIAEKSQELGLLKWPILRMALVQRLTSFHFLAEVYLTRFPHRLILYTHPKVDIQDIITQITEGTQASPKINFQRTLLLQLGGESWIYAKNNSNLWEKNRYKSLTNPPLMTSRTSILSINIARFFRLSRPIWNFFLEDRDGFEPSFFQSLITCESTCCLEFRF